MQKDGPPSSAGRGGVVDLRRPKKWSWVTRLGSMCYDSSVVSGRLHEAVKKKFLLIFFLFS